MVPDQDDDELFDDAVEDDGGFPEGPFYESFRRTHPRTCVTHLIPMRDIRPHVAGQNCACQPMLAPRPHVSGLVFVHRTWEVTADSLQQEAMYGPLIRH
jgi:hypothetical protein